MIWEWKWMELVLKVLIVLVVRVLVIVGLVGRFVGEESCRSGRKEEKGESIYRKGVRD